MPALANMTRRARTCRPWRLHEALHVGLDTHVGVDADGVTSCRLDLLGDRFGPPGDDVAGDDRGALRSANSSAPSGPGRIRNQ